jgi:hypothetical protein
MRKNALKDWHSTINSIKKVKKEGEYDCVLGYSGGKDSTALLDMLINQLNLNPLAITINTGQMSDIAKNNIKNTLETLEYSDHHILIEDAVPVFTKLYRFLFLNHKSNNEILTGNICDYCSDLIHSILTKEAIKKNIPLIILGYSPDQIKRYFYEIPREEITNEWFPQFIFDKPFTDIDRQFFLDPKGLNGKKIPRILLAYHVLPYDEQKIIKHVNSKNLIEKGKANPILTNCHVVKAALIYDFYRYGGLSYALQYAELVRQEPDETKRIRARRKWLRLYKNVAKLIVKGTFASDEVGEFLREINISKSELYNNISDYLEEDPNKDIILENINLFK